MAKCLALILLALPAAAEVNVGDWAPTIQLQDADGADRDVAESFGHWTALVFYPKDDTPGCTTEACSIRDRWADLETADIHVYGISVDPVDSKANFENKHGLRHVLLADVDKSVCEAYGTLMDRGFSARVTFILDPARQVRFVNRQVRVQQAAEDILAKVAELREADAATALAPLGAPQDLGLGFQMPVPEGWTAQPDAGGQSTSWVNPDDPSMRLTLSATQPEPATLNPETMAASLPAEIDLKVMERVTVAGQPAVRGVGIHTGDGFGGAGLRVILGGRDVTLFALVPQEKLAEAARLMAAIATGITAE